jgi:hypothetical protein
MSPTKRTLSPVIRLSNVASGWPSKSPGMTPWRSSGPKTPITPDMPAALSVSTAVMVPCGTCERTGTIHTSPSKWMSST